VTWDVYFTAVAEEWILGLDDDDYTAMLAAIELLEVQGPALGRPAADRIERSRHHNMKELRSFGGHLRALFAFDPKRRAIVLPRRRQARRLDRLVRAQHPARRRPLRRAPAQPRPRGLTMARTLNDIRAKRPLSPDARKRVDDIKRAMQLEIALAELRELRGASQAQVAETLGTSRPNVGRIEKELDVRLSTLERYVEALGGKLEIHAVFDDADIKLTA